MDVDLRRWTMWVTAGELIGFCAPALAAALTVGRPAGVLLPAVVAAGAIEGAVLGGAQVHALADEVPVSRSRWVLSTAAAGAVAWSLGMLPAVTAETWRSWSPGLLVAIAVLLGSALLASIGTAQWLELRRHVRRAGWWVAGTALAWGLGLASFAAVTSPLWRPGQPVVLVMAIGVLGGAVMAATMALVTGLTLRRLLRTSAGSLAWAA